MSGQQIRLWIKKKKKVQDPSSEKEIIMKLLTLFAPKSRTIHRLAHHPQYKPDCLLDADVIFVLLLQQALCRAIVRPDACCFPPRVVARWVRMIQLKTVMWIIARIEQGYTERT